MSSETLYGAPLYMWLPYETLTLIPNNNPPAVPSLWNTTYLEIQANFLAVAALIEGITVAGDNVYIETDILGKLTIKDNSITVQKLHTFPDPPDDWSDNPTSYVNGQNLLTHNNSSETIYEALQRLGALDPTILEDRIDAVTRELLDVIAELDLMRESPYDANGPYWVIMLDYVGKYGFQDGVHQFISDHNLGETSVGWRLRQFVQDKTTVGMIPQTEKYVGEIFKEYSHTTLDMNGDYAWAGRIAYSKGYIYILKEHRYILKVDAVSGEVVNTYTFDILIKSIPNLDVVRPFECFCINSQFNTIHLVTNGTVLASSQINEQKIITIKIDRLPQERNAVIDISVTNPTTSLGVIANAAESNFLTNPGTSPFVANWKVIGITSDKFDSTYLLLQAIPKATAPYNICNYQHIRKISTSAVLLVASGNPNTSTAYHKIDYFVNLADIGIDEITKLSNLIDSFQAIEKSDADDLEFWFYKFNNPLSNSGQPVTYRTRVTFSNAGGDGTALVYAEFKDSYGQNISAKHFVQDPFFDYVNGSWLVATLDGVKVQDGAEKSLSRAKLGLAAYRHSFSRDLKNNIAILGPQTRQFSTATPVLEWNATEKVLESVFDRSLIGKYHEHSLKCAVELDVDDNAVVTNISGDEYQIKVTLNSYDGVDANTYIATVKDSLTQLWLKLKIGCHCEFFEIVSNTNELDISDVPTGWVYINFIAPDLDLLLEDNRQFTVAEIGHPQYGNNGESVTKVGKILYKNFVPKHAKLTRNIPWEVFGNDTEWIPTITLPPAGIVTNTFVPNQTIRTDGIYMYASKYGRIYQDFDTFQYRAFDLPKVWNATTDTWDYYQHAIRTYGNLQHNETLIGEYDNKFDALSSQFTQTIGGFSPDPKFYANDTIKFLVEALIPEATLDFRDGSSASGLVPAGTLVGQYVKLVTPGSYYTGESFKILNHVIDAGNHKIHFEMVVDPRNVTLNEMPFIAVASSINGDTELATYTGVANIVADFKDIVYNNGAPFDLDFQLFAREDTTTAQLKAEILDDTGAVIAESGLVPKDLVNLEKNEIVFRFTGLTDKARYRYLQKDRVYRIRITNLGDEDVNIPGENFSTLFAQPANLTNVNKIYFNFIDSHNQISSTQLNTELIGQILENDEQTFVAYDTLDADNENSYSVSIIGKNYGYKVSLKDEFLNYKAFQTKEVWAIFATNGVLTNFIKPIDPDFSYTTLYLDVNGDPVDTDTGLVNPTRATVELQTREEARRFLVEEIRTMTQAEFDAAYPAPTWEFFKKKNTASLSSDVVSTPVVKRHYALTKVLDVIDNKIYAMAMNFAAPKIVPLRDAHVQVPSKWTSGYKYFDLTWGIDKKWAVGDSSIITGDGPQPKYYWAPGLYNPLDETINRVELVYTPLAGFSLKDIYPDGVISSIQQHKLFNEYVEGATTYTATFMNLHSTLSNILAYGQLEKGYEHFGSVIYVIDRNTGVVLDKWCDQAYKDSRARFSSLPNNEIIEDTFNWVYPFFHDIELQNGSMCYHHGYINFNQKHHYQRSTTVNGKYDSAFFSPGAGRVEPGIIERTYSGQQGNLAGASMGERLLGPSLIEYAGFGRLAGVLDPQRLAHYRRIFDCVDIKKILHRENGIDREKIVFGLVSYDETVETVVKDVRLNTLNQDPTEQINKDNIKPTITAQVYDTASFLKIADKQIKLYDDNESFLNHLPELSYRFGEPYLFMPTSCKLMPDGSFMFMIINANPGAADDPQMFSFQGNLNAGLSSSRTSTPAYFDDKLKQTMQMFEFDSYEYISYRLNGVFMDATGQPIGAPNTQFMMLDTAIANGYHFTDRKNVTFQFVGALMTPEYNVSGTSTWDGPGAGNLLDNTRDCIFSVRYKGKLPPDLSGITAANNTTWLRAHEDTNQIYYTSETVVVGPVITTNTTRAWSASGNPGTYSAVMTDTQRFFISNDGVDGVTMDDIYINPQNPDLEFGFLEKIDMSPKWLVTLGFQIDNAGNAHLGQAVDQYGGGWRLFPGTEYMHWLQTPYYYLEMIGDVASNVITTPAAEMELSSLSWETLNRLKKGIGAFNNSNDWPFIFNAYDFGSTGSEYGQGTSSALNSNISLQTSRNHEVFNNGLVLANPFLPHLFKLNIFSNELVDVTSKMPTQIKEKFWGKSQDHFASYLKWVPLIWGSRIGTTITKQITEGPYKGYTIQTVIDNKPMSGTSTNANSNDWFQSRKNDAVISRYTPTFFMNFPHQFSFSNPCIERGENGDIENVKVLFWSTFNSDSPDKDSIFEYSVVGDKFKEIGLNSTERLQLPLGGNFYEASDHFYAKFKAEYTDGEITYGIRYPNTLTTTQVLEKLYRSAYFYYYILQQFNLVDVSQILTLPIAIPDDPVILATFMNYILDGRKDLAIAYIEVEELTMTPIAAYTTFKSLYDQFQYSFNADTDSSFTGELPTALLLAYVLERYNIDLTAFNQMPVGEIVVRNSDQNLLFNSTGRKLYSGSVPLGGRLLGDSSNTMEEYEEANLETRAKYLNGLALYYHTLKTMQELATFIPQDNPIAKHLYEKNREYSVFNNINLGNGAKAYDYRMMEAIPGIFQLVWTSQGNVWHHQVSPVYDFNFTLYKLIKQGNKGLEEYQLESVIPMSNSEYGSNKLMNVHHNSLNDFWFNKSKLFTGGQVPAMSWVSQYEPEMLHIWDLNNRHVSRTSESLYESIERTDPNGLRTLSISTPKILMPQEINTLAEDSPFGTTSLYFKKGRLGNLFTKGDKVLLENGDSDSVNYGKREYIIVGSVEDDLPGRPCDVKVNLSTAILDETVNNAPGIDENSIEISLRFTEPGIVDRLPNQGVINIPVWQQTIPGIPDLDIDGNPIPLLTLGLPTYERIIYRGFIKIGSFQGTLLSCTRNAAGPSIPGISFTVAAVGHFNDDPIFFATFLDHVQGETGRWRVNKEHLEKMMHVRVYGGSENTFNRDEFKLLYNSTKQAQTELLGLEWDAITSQWEEINLTLYTEFGTDIVDKFYITAELFPTDYVRDSLVVGRINMFWTNPIEAP